MPSPFRGRVWALLSALALTSIVLPAVEARKTIYNRDLGLNGTDRELDASRYPALYSGNFDDCLGGESLFNVTKFDAAYYADNLTVLFHLDGTTNLRKEDVICKCSIPETTSMTIVARLYRTSADRVAN